MILLKSVHCLAVGIVALRDDANPSSWLFAFYPETLLRKWKPLKQASEMARSPYEVTEQCDIFCNLFPFLQELEQEKYHLRRRLDAVQEEYDLKVGELQQDLKTLQAQLDEHGSQQRQSEKEKSLLITTLSEQNQRLTTQLKEVSEAHRHSIFFITVELW